MGNAVPIVSGLLLTLLVVAVILLRPRGKPELSRVAVAIGTIVA